MSVPLRSAAARLAPQLVASASRAAFRPPYRTLLQATPTSLPNQSTSSLKAFLACLGVGVAATSLYLAQKPLWAEDKDTRVATRRGAPPPNLDDPHVRSLRELFLKYASVEVEDTLYLTADDFLKCLTQDHMGHDDVNLEINLKKFKKLFDLVSNGSNQVMSFADFVNLDRILNMPQAEYVLAFLIADRDGSGYITKEEFNAVLQANARDDAVPFNMDSDFVRLYFGSKGNGRLSFEEFTQLLKGLHVEKMRQEFQYYDKEGTGYVSGEIFERIISDVGLMARIPKYLQESLKSVENLAHRNGEKGVSYAHIIAFNNLLLHIPSYVRVFRAAQREYRTEKVSKEQFLRAAHDATTIEITPMEAELVFHFFDINRDGYVDLNMVARVIEADRLRRENILKLTSDMVTASAIHSTAIHESPKPKASGFAALMKDSAIHFTLGAIAGGIGATAVYPIDLVKTRMQNQRAVDPSQRLYANSLDCFKKVLRNEGFAGLYKGLLPQLVGVAPEKAIKLTVNDLLRNLFGTKQHGDIYFPLEVLAGGGAGASQVIFTNPLEIVKIRLQIQGEKLKTGVQLEKQGAISLLRELGISGLYKGAGACLLRDVPFSAIYFPLYAHLKKRFESEDGTISAGRLLLAGTLSGVPAAGLVTPADVIKTRLQVKARAGEEVYAGIRDCFWKILTNEGAAALWKVRQLNRTPTLTNAGSSGTCVPLVTSVWCDVGVLRTVAAELLPGYRAQADIASAFGSRNVLSNVERVENKWFALFSEEERPPSNED